MKKTLIALAVLAASGAAMAQSSVTMFGRLDVGVGQNRTTGAETQTLVSSSSMRTTYWGIKGTEDLGGGLKANFELQSQFGLDTGAIADKNTFAERFATVGLSGGFGALNLGRQYTAYDTIRGASNNVWDSNFASTGKVWGNGVADYSNRMSNSVRYDTPVMAGFSGALGIGLGENEKIGATNLGDSTDVVSLHVKYVMGPLMVGYGHQEEKLAQTVLATPQVTNKYDVFGATYDFGIAKLVGTYNQAKNGTLKDKEYQVGVSVPLGSAAAVAVGYANSNSETLATAAEVETKGYSLVGTYNLSKRTQMYAGYRFYEASTTKDIKDFGLGVVHLF